jgi:hypothetical protein
MATTARIIATTAASTAYTATIEAGAVGNFIAIGMVNDDFPIVFEGSDAAGTGFTPLTYLDKKGDRMVAQLAIGYETIQLVGPIDFRINKPTTANAVEVSQYT